MTKRNTTPDASGIARRSSAKVLRPHRGAALLSAVKWVVALAVLVLVIAWLSGLFKAKVPAGHAPVQQVSVPTDQVMVVEATPRPVILEAVGTVRALHETAVGSRLLARIEKVHVRAGDRVERDQILVELDKADIEARFKRARANLEATRARLEQAQSDLDNLRSLLQSNAATERELSDQVREVRVASAEVEAAQQAVNEAEAQLEFVHVRSPIDGVVIERLIEPGDLARPGQDLVTLYDPDRLQLEAQVPERVAITLQVGDTVDARIDALNMQATGTISEIVPQAAAQSRSMLVKVTLPGREGAFSGMFGRLLIQTGQQPEIWIPDEAIRRIGQLEMVQVIDASGQPRQRLVRSTNRARDGKLRIVAGLEPGENIVQTFEP